MFKIGKIKKQFVFCCVLGVILKGDLWKMKISDEVVKQVRDNSDIVEVLDRYLTLKRSGDNYLALCPFHSEKTPSFVVSSKKQIFKCFGCGESGNVISFVMKYRGLDFVESIKFLASDLGVVIADGEKFDNLKKYYDILVDAARYFYINLKKNANIVNYLKNRGLDRSIITKFGIGYSLDSFNSLNKYLVDRGYRVEDLLNIGLVGSKKGSYYDKFMNRVMFPIFSYSGKVIGFGARVIDNRLPKYLNSKDSIVFKKGDNLYAMNFLLKSSNTFDSIIIVEGYMDCISLHSNGFTNVVASMGTALTLEQVKLLVKYTNRVYLCFDNDDAGKEAVARSFNVLKDFFNDGLEVYVVELNDAKDPDEFLKKYGKLEFLSMINSSKMLIEYLLEFYKQKIGIEDNSHKKRYLKVAIGIIEQLDIVDREHYIKLLASNLKIREDIVIKYFDNEYYNHTNQGNYFELEDKFIEKAHIKAEKQLLNLMLKREYLTYILNSNVDESLFSLDVHKSVFRAILEFNSDESQILTYLEKKLNTYEEIKVIIYFKESSLIYDNNNITDQIDDFIKILRKNVISDFKERITHIIEKYESNADENKFVEYLSILNTVSKLEIEEKLSEAMDFIKVLRCDCRKEDIL